MSFSKFIKAVWGAIAPEPETVAPSSADSPKVAATTPAADEWTAAEAAVVPFSTPVAPGALQGRCGLSLRPWDDKFAGVVSGWRNDMRFLHLWNSSRKPSTQEEFWADICHMLEHTTFFLIHLAGQEEPVGCVYAGRPASRAQKYLQVNTLLPPENQKLGHGIAATFLFVRHLFDQFEISKVVLEVYGWNAGSIKATAHMPQVKLEGIRRNHVYLNGKPYDHYEFGVSREAFQEVMKSPPWKRLIGE